MKLLTYHEFNYQAGFCGGEIITVIGRNSPFIVLEDRDSLVFAFADLFTGDVYSFDDLAFDSKIAIEEVYKNVEEYFCPNLYNQLLHDTVTYTSLEKGNGGF